ncbi:MULTISPECIES: carboxymuconolactone decarboxylase family protein [unclassified Sphingobium]|uniref:carboxymuconolactone decarboxylase family protein n=1 Tax=unclassified Sphingobium TaxID=2611147 RepID=UPI000D177375|nr:MULTISPECIES: carboxymuconolactone decarboxylase family protein [unclassified Sphingobium]MBG6120066.1 alkylhydroperoxidase family enzyme [Sphingobium sp. JAI105]PSO12881.1 hypothetical protein C7E20_03785 [Sphingobium sp. AEW4]TWD05733.1 alkylhydroperoxidase family enzyme [Sphingobium sp. AEW010]TWD23286.1 alkylhydroperoxidase family enzyme [Sphingobium sp. AEW013]TWD25146.1 alkylhydroperoxidase family enzyme [Sphingobium sp. AEW001]
MPRIDLPPSEDYSLSRVAFTTYAPEIGATASAFSLKVYEKSLLSLREMEGARYRTALINGCNVCTNTRAGRDMAGHIGRNGGSITEGPLSRGPAPDEAFYEAVAQWQTSPLFSERERIAIELAERMGERPHSMADDETFWERIHAHYSDAEIVDMTLSIASWIGLGRVVHTLELDAVCMPTFADAA